MVTERWLVAAQRILRDLAELDLVANHIRDGLARAPQSEDAEFIWEAIAAAIEDLYSGLERAFEVIAEMVDEVTPTGQAWHRDLLEQMAVALPGRRHQVISSETFAYLDELRRFRHRMRNLYMHQLDLGIVGRLAESLERFAAARDEVQRFAQSLTGSAS
jgi:hypothetical protein